MAIAGDIVGLGYLGLQSQNLEHWRGFGSAVLGMALVPDSHPDRVRFRLDEQAWRIEIAQASTDGLAFIGWQVADEDALERVTQRIEKTGVRICESGAVASDRGVLRAVRFADPAGLAVELFVGPRMPAIPFVSPTGARFVTGALGLGHLVVRVGDHEECVGFYKEAMGFGVSDLLTMNAVTLTFLHCNARHHSLALATPAYCPQLLHFMVEVADLDTVGLALDRCAQHDAVLVKTLGRHSNDSMISFYARTPGGCEVEYGWGGRIIDPSTWEVTRSVAPSLWGHRQLVERH